MRITMGMDRLIEEVYLDIILYLYNYHSTSINPSSDNYQRIELNKYLLYNKIS